MHIFDIAALLITVSALLSFVNYRYIKLPSSIGLMLIALGFSLGIIALGKLGFGGLESRTRYLIESIDFSDTLMHGMLSFLLFAGALHVDINDLAKQKWTIALLATIGVILSTLIVGVLTWFALHWLDVQMPLIYCFVFGALISPTDPIAVLGILKNAGAGKALETKITGESLFNDGVAVVVFIVVVGIAASGDKISPPEIVWLFVEEAVGGVLFGMLLGAAGYRLLCNIDNYQVEILITLAMVMGGYSLATFLHVSGPIAMVVAGLVIGNQGRRLAMSEKTRGHLDTFWDLIDETLNTVLFVLMGMEVLVLEISTGMLAAVGPVIAIVLIARFLSVGAPIGFMRLRRGFSPHTVTILTWGGLRGGISIALALSLPLGGEREQILVMTYAVVVFSILVQGLTIGRVVGALGGAAGSRQPGARQ